ncbi:hypothetical protein AcW1_002347 [Taiwanofungus camphoratus]|nr:hypothetical protein AcW1_002347 [Antrodia cinnamomea]
MRPSIDRSSTASFCINLASRNRSGRSAMSSEGSVPNLSSASQEQPRVISKPPTGNPMSQTFPTEVFELVISFVRDYKTVLACSLTCRAWVPRSRYYLFRQVQFLNPQRLDQFAELVTANPFLGSLVRELYIPLGDGQHSPRSKVFAMFPFVLAHRLPAVEHLLIGPFGNNPIGVNQLEIPSFHQQYLHTMSEFASITRIDLWNTRFHSLTEFGRFVCSLPGLCILNCSEVSWKTDAYSPHAFKPRKADGRLHRLFMVAVPFSADMVNWLLVPMSVTACLANIVLPSIYDNEIEHAARLLEAVGPSLHHLAIGFGVRESEKTSGLEQNGEVRDIGRVPDLKQAVERRLNLRRNDCLRTIYLRFNNSGGWAQKILSQVVSDQVSRIDKTLSSKRFARMEELIFEHSPRLNQDQVSWLTTEMSHRFPLMDARKIIRLQPWSQWLDL